MQRTKIAGILLVVVAVLHTAIDVLDGSGFDLSAHVSDVIAALNGAGLYFLRDAIAKISGKL